MRRHVPLLAAAGLTAGLLVLGLPAQSAAAEARCQLTIGATHSHWHAAHGHYHTWRTVDVDRFPGRVIVTQYMAAENRSDTASC
jgi:hypothetical protein